MTHYETGQVSSLNTPTGLSRSPFPLFFFFFAFSRLFFFFPAPHFTCATLDVSPRRTFSHRLGDEWICSMTKE